MEVCVFKHGRKLVVWGSRVVGFASHVSYVLVRENVLGERGDLY